MAPYRTLAAGSLPETEASIVQVDCAMKRLSASALHFCGLVFPGIRWAIVLGLFTWSVGAVYSFSLLPRFVTVPLAVAYLAAVGYAFTRIKPPDRWRQLVAAAVAVIYLICLTQRPSNNRQWAPDNAVVPDVIITGNNISVTGFRHSVYRSESVTDVHYHDCAFRLTDLQQVWFVVQRFTTLEGIAHNFLTFSVAGADGPRYFSVSVEIRREEGESFDPVKGLYRQYELIYIIADERDEIGSRTVLRPDDRVFLYPVNATPVQVQQLFLDIVARIQILREHPEFYHSLANNCTNNIVNHAYKFTPLPISSLDPRILAPGFADRLAFAKGLIGIPGETFEGLQQRCRIDEIAREVGITDNFSEHIRRRVDD